LLGRVVQLPTSARALGCRASQAVVKTVDMTEDMEKDAIEQAVFAMNEFVREVDMAAHIKKEFDKKYRCVEPPHDRLHQCLGLASSSLHAVHSDARKTATAARHLLNPHLACVCSHVAHQPPRGPSSFTRHRAAPPFVDPCRLLPPLRLFQATENAQEEKPKQLEKQKTIGERISEGLASLVPTFSENAEKQILDDASDTETDVETPILVDEHLDISEAPLSPIIKPEVVCVAEPEAGHAEQNKLFEETQKQEEQNKLFEETQKQEQEESAPADLGEPKKRKMSITETIGAGLSAIVSTISGGNATPKATLDEAPAMPENPEPAKVEEKAPEPAPAEAPAPVEVKTDTEAAPAPKTVEAKTDTDTEAAPAPKKSRERRERKPRDHGGLKNKWAAKKAEAEAED